MAEPTQRPEGAPDPNHSLLVAARYNDADSEECGLQEAVERQGIDFETFKYVCEQRAMSLVLLRTGRAGELQRAYRTGKPHAFKVSTEDRAAIDALMPLYMDAMLIGWRARELEDRDADTD